MRQPSLSSYTPGIVDVLAGWRACAEPIPPKRMVGGMMGVRGRWRFIKTMAVRP
jgi:hypothetical protein